MKKIYTSLDQLPVSISVPEMAYVLGISRAKAYELVRSNNGVKTVRIGKRIVVPTHELKQWITENTNIHV